jgi:protein SCO1/2
VVKGDRLDSVSNNGIVSDKLVVIGPAPKFELIDQNKKTITNKDYSNKVYVLEFFFATCPSICPKMNKNLIEVQNQFFGNPNFGIVSITIDPEHDTAEVLKAHAELLGVSHQIGIF